MYDVESGIFFVFQILIEKGLEQYLTYSGRSNRILPRKDPAEQHALLVKNKTR